MRRLYLSNEEYRILLVCLRFCEEDLKETEGFLESAFPELTEADVTPRKRTTLRRVQQLQVAVETSVEEA